MYSKANSQTKYMNLETLWDRANDAINTIFRLDESTETGVFLQPCIEVHENCHLALVCGFQETQSWMIALHEDDNINDATRTRGD
ncbi:hypothetical protein M8C21_014653 [Ambrosia artemisiifolia]|uniref:Uncharacterized protein n=1 Tax=Ambrosia artemisiifolia TaxID=4212 RepID=A0AAD5GZW9_AMBAR|nr:hypothetical protein M8C21_014653 [Ambrosia artemisiifolia]